MLGDIEGLVDAWAILAGTGGVVSACVHELEQVLEADRPLLLATHDRAAVAAAANALLVECVEGLAGEGLMQQGAR